MHSHARLLIRYHLLSVLFVSSAVLILFSGRADSEETTKTDTETSSPLVDSPLTPEESLSSFELHPDLQLELVASEPEVIDPVAIRFDELGNMWVVEMIDYPLGPKSADEVPMSRIRKLRDEDQDGYYETSTVFADKLLFVTGVLPWKEGLIATLSGEVVYLKDTDQDGKADVKETWFVGFAEENTQLRANHPTFGLDNKVYISNGLRGGEVRNVNPAWADQAKSVPLSLRGKDFRFDPETGEYETVAGNGQFGLTIDSNGSRYICSNRNPCMQVLLEDHYLARNPQLIVPTTVNDVSPAGGESRVYAITRAWTTSNLHAGQFTAACGVHRYEGTRLPAEFYGNSFTCEPTGNLVHRDVFTPSGATFSSHYGREQTEFLASRDEWFRPVNVQTGPDGALYICDMYRAVIEHPHWVPDELKNRPDERYGDDLGRIYRVVPKKKTDSDLTRTIDRTNQSALLSAIVSPNSWQRSTAARLIFEEQPAGLEHELRRSLKEAVSPEGRVQVLHTLAGLNQLAKEDLLTAFQDKHPRVREHAALLSETFLAKVPELQQAMLDTASEGDSRTLFQYALSSGAGEDSTFRQQLLTQVVSNGVLDQWTRAAIISSATNLEGEMLGGLLQKITNSEQAPSAMQQNFFAELALIVGANKDPHEVSQVLKLLIDLFQQSRSSSKLVVMESLKSFLTGYQTRGERKAISTLSEYLSEESQTELDQMWVQLVELVGSEQGETALSQAALPLLIYTPSAETVPVLTSLLDTTNNQALQQQTLEILGAHPGTEPVEFLLDEYELASPRIRRAILAYLLRDQERIQTLFDEIEGKKIRAAELDQNQQKALMNHANAEIKSRAQELLKSNISADRTKVIERYQASLAKDADAKRGKVVFAKVCSSCHKVGDIGVDVAPDISDSRVRKPIQYLTDILDPNRAVDNNYFSYTVLTTEGQIHTGIITSETSTSIILKQPEAKEVSLLREDIELIKADGVSLMPTGLEQNITVDQMADLISFLKNWRYLDGQIPIEANQPLN
ncbi:PVC-type heme-binding CxxCH protein [Polystyrenella longa]|nr:PVC-type heme-binding CxxCH protein [Polystyrenella longa]